VHVSTSAVKSNSSGMIFVELFLVTHKLRVKLKKLLSP